MAASVFCFLWFDLRSIRELERMRAIALFAGGAISPVGLASLSLISCRGWEWAVVDPFAFWAARACWCGLDCLWYSCVIFVRVTEFESLCSGA